jgi:hypothetical protein
MGNNTPKKNRTSEVTADQKLIAGLTKHAATLPSFVVAGVSTTNADVIAKLQARIAAENAVPPARATWQAAVSAARSEIAATKSVVSAVKQAVLAAFAGQVDALGDFGLTPRKARVLTPEAKVAATAKAKATRAARHTAGSVQKKAVKGDVTGVVVTPVTSAPTNVVTPPGGTTPAPSPAPTPAAGSTTPSGGTTPATTHAS